MYCKNCGKELADGMKFCVACGEPVALPEKEDAAGSDETQDETPDQSAEQSDSEPQEDSTEPEPNNEEQGDRAQDRAHNDAGEDRMPEREGDRSGEDRTPEQASDGAGAPEEDRMPGQASGIEEDRMPSSSAEQNQHTAPQPSPEPFAPSEQQVQAQQIPAGVADAPKKKSAATIFAAAAVGVLVAVIVMAVVITRPTPGGSVAINASVSGGASVQDGAEKESSSTDAAKQEAEDKAKREAEEKAKKEAEEKARQEAEAAAKAEEEARKAEEERRSQAVANAESRGMQVFTGTVMAGSFKDIAEYEGGASLTAYNAFGRNSSDSAAILILDSTQNVSLETIGGYSSQEVSHFSLAISDSSINYLWPYADAVDQWEQSNGEHVVVAGNPLFPAGETFPICPQLNNAELLYVE